MIHRLLVSMIWAVALAVCGCDGSAKSYEASLDAPIQLAPGQSAELAAGDFEVEFTGIASDSRCPVDLTCLWAGEVVVQLAIRSDGKRRSQHELPELQKVAVDGHTVTVLGVLPSRGQSEQRIQPADYRVTLKISR